VLSGWDPRGGDPITSFLAQGGAAVLLEFNSPWGEIFSMKKSPVIRGSVKCACGEIREFDFLTSRMTWVHQGWCDMGLYCEACDRKLSINLTTHGDHALLLYINRNEDLPLVAGQGELRIREVALAD